MAPSFEDSIIDMPSKTMKSDEVKSIQKEDGEKDDLVLRVFRCLIADLCEQFKGGHPGYVFACCVLSCLH